MSVIKNNFYLGFYTSLRGTIINFPHPFAMPRIRQNAYQSIQLACVKPTISVHFGPEPTRIKAFCFSIVSNLGKFYSAHRWN